MTIIDSTAAPAFLLMREECGLAEAMGQQLIKCEDGKAEIVLRDLREDGFCLAYASQVNNDGTVKWRTAWTGSDMPRAVKVDLALMTNAGRTLNFGTIALSLLDVY